LRCFPPMWAHCERSARCGSCSRTFIGDTPLH
jgi:hypothetical protein